MGKKHKKITLSQTDKKGLALKQKLIDELRKCIDKYETLFLFSTDNMRNIKLKELREEWKEDSRFFFGKQRILQLGLGKSVEDEYHTNLHKVSQMITGHCALLFTNRPELQVRDYFGTFSVPEYARSGFVAKETIVLPAGPYVEFPFNTEAYLRNILGMPTALQRGVVFLVKDYELSTKNKRLTPAQAQVLKLMGKQTAEFRLHLKCVWKKSTGKVKKIKMRALSESRPTENAEKKHTDDGSVDEDISLRMDLDESVEES